MPSPFPGMDPYLESPELWPGVHNALAAEIQAALNHVMQPDYVAMLEAHLVYEVVEVSAVRRARPDVSVLRPEPAGPGGVAMPTMTLAPAPLMSAVPLDLPIELFSVEIRRSHVGTLVTVIEILSPANKRRGEQAFDDYRRKRRDLLRTQVHLLEIDLLRAGERPPLTQPVPAAPYYVTLSRGERRPKVEVWPIQLADRLPAVPVPLLAPDPDVALDLGALIASVYARGAFGRVLDYSEPPPPPALSAAEKGWLAGVVRNG
jgi:hypothetical protein